MMNYRVIQREEYDLEAPFVESYIDYKHEVSRWL